MSSDHTNTIEQNLADWEKSLFKCIPIAGLMSRNSIVYKYKAPFRSWLLRESTFWRLHDLMKQSYLLYQNDHLLGARILLRSGFETFAHLVYLNQISEKVIQGNMSFDDWGQKTSQLYLGSKKNTEMPQSINIITIFEKCEKRYPGLMNIYASLSESAHPSYEGLCLGYSLIDHDGYETIFNNRWAEIYAEKHPKLMALCIESFNYEYDTIWPDLLKKIEGWIEENNSILEDNANFD